jgi:hypothetical protein
MGGVICPLPLISEGVLPPSPISTEEVIGIGIVTDGRTIRVVGVVAMVLPGNSKKI